MTVTADLILREYHRRLTHFEKQEPTFTPLARAQVAGELIGLRGALGIALGGSVRGGDADRLAVQEHTRWRGSEGDAAACTCDECESVVGRLVLLCGNSEGEAYVPFAREKGDAA